MSTKIIEMFKKNSAIATGERIYLKIMQEENATVDYCDWLNDVVVNKYLETRSVTIKELKKYIKEKLVDDNCLFFGIFMKIDNRHIGNLKLEPINWQKKTAVFGILIGDKNYWGKGVGTEATKLAIDFSLNSLGLNELELGVISKNTGAIKVFKKSGFKVVEILEKEMNHDGVLYDKVVMKVKK